MTQPGSSSPDSRVPDAQSEQRVLAELEQLRLAIRTIREKGEPLEGNFSAQPQALDPPPVRAPLAPAAREQRGPAATVVTRELERLSLSDRAADVTGRVADRQQPIDSAPPSSEVVVPPRSTRRVMAFAAATMAIVVLAALWVINRAPAPPQAVAQVAAPAPISPPVELAPGKPVAQVDPHRLRIDLTTVRTVWLRVAVDGRIAIEREVAAGEQLPFGADRSIAVRAGDAGAVTVRVGGVEQGPLGRDGQVLTRAFALPE